MPELPEVEGLAVSLGERLADRVVADVALASFSALKTVDVLPQSLHGRPVDDVRRYGKLLDLVVDEAAADYPVSVTLRHVEGAVAGQTGGQQGQRVQE